MKSILTICSIICMVCTVAAQQKIITGKVTDEYQQPLPGVSVLVKGTTTGTQTDFDGVYSITANEGDVLVFTYIGFVSQELKIKKSNVMNLTLLEDAAALDEVVITSLGVKRNTSKRERKQNALANQYVASQLSGKVSGVQVQNANAPAVVGSTTQIVVRGNSTVNNAATPLVVVNGVVSSMDSVHAINPSAIEKVNVLKGGNATALYGSQAQNGVLIITTKDQAVTPKEVLYIVDGKPIDKAYNAIIAKLPDSAIKKKEEFTKGEAKRKFGDIAKHGCIQITTTDGNFQILENESYAIVNENAFENVQSSPLSTFSIDVDKAGYSNIRRMINNGMPIPPDAVKIEEMVNYFTYNYPQPTEEHPFSITTDVAKTPWNSDTQLVRVGLQGKTFENEDLPPSNLTFLIDVSGSMSSYNKLPLLKNAFKLLVNQLRDEDRVSIVVYAGAAGVVLEPTKGSNKTKILQALDKLEAGGSTAGGAGIALAYKLAEENFKKKGNNRVILATDGDFNVGASSDKAMETLIEEKRASGVFLSVLGFGMGNYKDSKLETLADKGNGNHAYIDTMQEAQKVFGQEFGGTLYTIAKDVKIQVEFNPSKVMAYRLIGYENRMLAAEDFVDDTKDAGELGAGHTVTALYEVIPVGSTSEYLKAIPNLKYTKAQTSSGYDDELFTVKFRYKKPDADKSIEMVKVQQNEISDMAEDFKFAAAVALFGMQQKQSAYYNNATEDLVLQLATEGKGDDSNGYRAEFLRLVQLVQ